MGDSFISSVMLLCMDLRCSYEYLMYDAEYVDLNSSTCLRKCSFHSLIRLREVSKCRNFWDVGK